MVTPTFARLMQARVQEISQGRAHCYYLLLVRVGGGGATQFLVTLFVKVKTKIAGGWAVDMEPLAHG